MNRTIGYITLLAYAAIAVAIVAARPEWASDQNLFLRGFVNHEFLSLLAVILAITLASVVNIHFEFNKIEEKHQKQFLFKSRQNLAKNAHWLIGLFVVAVVLVAIKPMINNGQVAEAVINLGAISIVLWHVLILISLTHLAFAIEPDFKPPVCPKPQSPPSAEEKKRL